MNQPLALEQVFLHLAREGVPLSVRDLADALRALAAGFGIGSRRELMELCQALWARSDEERRRIAILFSDVLPTPTAEEVAALSGKPFPPVESLPTSGAAPRQFSPESPASTAGLTSIEIAAPESTGGVGLPKAAVPAYAREPFILNPRPLVPLRGCVISWRRFRRAMRTGPRTELDIHRTVLEKSRAGFLGEPVLVPRRANQARLVLLLDAGPSMAAWRDSTRVLKESLEESRLAQFAVFYFHETPQRLFETEELTGPVALPQALRRFPEMPVMIVSDAGAARGGIDLTRIAQTRESLARFGLLWRPAVWLNPMPVTRWRRTSADSISRLPALSMLPFTTDGLTQAVDVLRGLRQR